MPGDSGLLCLGYVEPQKAVLELDFLWAAYNDKASVIRPSLWSEGDLGTFPVGGRLSLRALGVAGGQLLPSSHFGLGFG